MRRNSTLCARRLQIEQQTADPQTRRFLIRTWLKRIFFTS
jgi:hypothetical protein